MVGTTIGVPSSGCLFLTVDWPDVAGPVIVGLVKDLSELEVLATRESNDSTKAWVPVPLEDIKKSQSGCPTARDGPSGSG